MQCEICKGGIVMKNSIVCKLISNDLKINRKPILMWMLAAIAGIVTAYMIPGLVTANIGFSLMASAIIGSGIHMIAHTVLLANVKGTHIFILSLPINFKQYSIAKFTVNILVFLGMWLVLSAAAIYITISQSIFPNGSLPMILLVLLSILPVYSLILSICVITQSIGYTAATAVTGSFATSVYLWKIVYLESVGNYVWGNQAVWNNTVIGVMILQIMFAIIIPVLTILFQFKKKDLI